MPLHPVAASASVARVLTGPARPVTVAAVTPAALYLATGDPDRPALCLATPAAVRPPCALVLGDGAALPALAVGDPGTAGDGALAVGTLTVRVGRWWRPPRPNGLDRAPSDRLCAAAQILAATVPDPLDDAGRAALRSLGPAPVEAVAGLLGRGPGLTPLGDDVLAGALVTLSARGIAAPGLRAVVLAGLARTTFVSAALLRHAADGECVPQLAALLDAIRDSGSVEKAVAGLLGVGHTSGAGLAYGVLAALSLETP